MTSFPFEGVELKLNVCRAALCKVMGSCMCIPVVVLFVL